LKLQNLQGCAEECRVFRPEMSQETVCGGAEEVNPATPAKNELG
jgi:hypothetical protein